MRGVGAMKLFIPPSSPFPGWLSPSPPLSLSLCLCPSSPQIDWLSDKGR